MYTFHSFLWAQCYWVAHGHTLECANVSATAQGAWLLSSALPQVLHYLHPFLSTCSCYFTQLLLMSLFTHTSPRSSPEKELSGPTHMYCDVVSSLKDQHFSLSAPRDFSSIKGGSSAPCTGSGFDILYPANGVSESVDLIFQLL